MRGHRISNRKHQRPDAPAILESGRGNLARPPSRVERAALGCEVSLPVRRSRWNVCNFSRRRAFDSDLAAVYGVTTARLNQQVNRNRDRFPADFIFQIADQFGWRRAWRDSQATANVYRARRDHGRDSSQLSSRKANERLRSPCVRKTAGSTCFKLDARSAPRDIGTIGRCAGHRHTQAVRPGVRSDSWTHGIRPATQLTFPNSFRQFELAANRSRCRRRKIRGHRPGDWPLRQPLQDGADRSGSEAPVMIAESVDDEHADRARRFAGADARSEQR